MKWVWAVAAISLACAGCKPQASALPPPTACRVDLTRLERVHPRWQELRSLDERIREVRERLHPGVAPSAAAPLPAPLPPVPHPADPAERAVPESLEEMAAARDAAVRAQQNALAERHKARLERERLEREAEKEFLVKQQRTLAFEELWQEQNAVIRRYQPEITRLRVLIARLRDPSPVPDPEKRRVAELDQRIQELTRLERQRNAALEAVAKRVEERLAQEMARRNQEDTAALEALRAELKSQQEMAIRTAEQDWQDRIDAVAEALREPPPGPVPAGVREDAPPVAARTEITPAPDSAQAADAAGAILARQRTRLYRLIQAETRQRVLGIAARHNLRPVFDGGTRLPDRTQFFLRELQHPGL